MKRLVLFDIDGTLISTHGVAKETFAEVLESVYETRTIARSHDFAGKTDLQIIYEVMTGSGLTEKEINERLATAVERIFILLEPRLTPESVRVHDGVFELLDQLSTMNECTLALLTGNMERGARMKLAPHGLNTFFPFGAFGNDARYRNELPAIALRRAKEKTGNDYRDKEVVIIGDTPHDITCGAHLNVRTIAVATGGTSFEKLNEYTPDSLFSSLSDTQLVLEAIFNEGKLI